MWLMLQQEKPEDFVLATGETTSVRDFVRMSFREIGVELEFKGEGEQEVGIVTASTNADYQLTIGREVVAVDPRYFRPTEVELLIGDPTKAEEKLGWERKYNLASMTAEMVQKDIELFRKNQFLQKAGFTVKNEFE
jgi:GDPmannose 4,6-dehydratase